MIGRDAIRRRRLLPRWRAPRAPGRGLHPVLALRPAVEEEGGGGEGEGTANPTTTTATTTRGDDDGGRRRQGAK